MEVSLEDEVWGTLVTSAVFFLCEANELTEMLREDWKRRLSLSVVMIGEILHIRLTNLTPSRETRILNKSMNI